MNPLYFLESSHCQGKIEFFKRSNSFRREANHGQIIQRIEHEALFPQLHDVLYTLLPDQVKAAQLRS